MFHGGKNGESVTTNAEPKENQTSNVRKEGTLPRCEILQ